MPSMMSATEDQPGRPLLVTIEEAATLLGVGRTTVYELHAEAELVSLQIHRRRGIATAGRTSDGGRTAPVNVEEHLRRVGRRAASRTRRDGRSRSAASRKADAERWSRVEAITLDCGEWVDPAGGSVEATVLRYLELGRRSAA